MNYYEELGIDRDANISEIREAYKLAARLLHPDVQRDPRLKELAEREMKRLGGIVAVLVDPRERARYDAELATRVVRYARRCSRGPAGRSCCRLWCATGSGFCWDRRRSGRGRGTGSRAARTFLVDMRAAESAEAAAVPAVSGAAKTPVRSRPVKSAETTVARKVGQAPPLRPTQREASEPGPSVTTPAPVETPVEAAAVEPGAGTAAQKAAGRSGAERRRTPLCGGMAVRGGRRERKIVRVRIRRDTWSFGCGPTGGTLVGDYRAVHTLLDKAISPEIAFDVSGESPRGNAGSWNGNRARGPGGSWS